MLFQMTAAVALQGCLLRWKLGGMAPVQQTIRGYMKNFYNKKTAVPPVRGWMHEDRYATRNNGIGMRWFLTSGLPCNMQYALN